MLYHALAEFLELLERHEELARVNVEVDSELEITEITARVGKSSNRAILFERVRGRQMPVVTNLLGSQRRICLALGVHSLAEVGQRLLAMWRPAKAEGWLDKLKTVPASAGLEAFAPRRAKTGLCQQVVRLASDVDLRAFALVKGWPLDGRPVIASGQLATRDPETRVRRVATFPLEVVDANRLLVHWDPAADALRSLEAHARRGEKMPVAVLLGGDPLATLVSLAPFATGLDTLALAGLLRAQPIEVVKCRTHDLEVPAGAEIVLEGFVDPRAAEEQGGGFALATGYYQIPAAARVCEVTAITHRVNPIVVAGIAGRPPQEGCAVRQAAEQIIVPVMRTIIPELVAIELPDFGARRHVAFVAIRKAYPGQARQVASAIWGVAPWMRTKIVVVVDAQVDVTDDRQVWFYVAANVDPSRDVFFHDGPADPWDHAGRERGLARKMGIDATAKLPGESPQPWPSELVMNEAVRDLVSGRWGQYGLGSDPGATL